jgi:hypothetical protein
MLAPKGSTTANGRIEVGAIEAWGLNDMSSLVRQDEYWPDLEINHDVLEVVSSQSIHEKECGEQDEGMEDIITCYWRSSSRARGL